MVDGLDAIALHGSLEVVDVEVVEGELAALLAQGAWSQYLEVGIGPDAEIFTKAQPMSAVGVGADVQSYRYLQHYWWREVWATSLAWWEAKISHPVPIMGDPLPIFPEDC